MMVIGLLGVTASDVLSRTLFSFDGTRITVSSVLVIALVLLATFVFSRYVRKAIDEKVLKKRGIERGLRHLVLRVTHYVIIVVGAMVALNVIGIQLTALVALAGVASLALGFGLQTIVSNFMSGIIIMAERNVKVGEIIEVGNKMGEVINIETRATTIRTFDNVAVIVPNEDFIAKEVVNWSSHDPKVRVSVPVDVAYGSDVQKVKEVLIEVAEGDDEVLDRPGPEVRFESFGDNSLNFKLLAWVPYPQSRKPTISRLNFEIDRRFREEEIAMPFPQRSVWFKNELRQRGPESQSGDQHGTQSGGQPGRPPEPGNEPGEAEE